MNGATQVLRNTAGKGDNWLAECWETGECANNLLHMEINIGAVDVAFSYLI